MSIVSICNEALGLLGAGRINSLDDTNTPKQEFKAGLCKTLYDPVRRAVLEDDWTFARSQHTLVREQAEPEFKYQFKYLLPPTVLVVRWVGQDPDSDRQLEEWERVGNRIFANVNTNNEFIYIWSTEDVTDVNLFSAGFRQALATRLAARMAVPLTESKTREEQLWKVYGAQVAEALASDGQQGRTRVTRATRMTRIRGRGQFGFFQSQNP